MPGATHRCTWTAWRNSPMYLECLAQRADIPTRGEGVRLEARLRRSRPRGRRPFGSPPAEKPQAGKASVRRPARGEGGAGNSPSAGKPPAGKQPRRSHPLAQQNFHPFWMDRHVCPFHKSIPLPTCSLPRNRKVRNSLFANHTLWISNLKYLRCVPWMLGARLRKQMEHCVSISMSMAFNVPHANPQQQSKNCDRGRHFFQKETETVVMVAPPKKPFLHLCFSLAAAPRLPQLPRRPHKAPMSSPGHINSHAACWAAWRCTSAAPFVGRPQCLAHSPFIESTTARENLTISARNCCCLLRVIENLSRAFGIGF